jgi:hypothetical protein
MVSVCREKRLFPLVWKACGEFGNTDDGSANDGNDDDDDVDDDEPAGSAASRASR